MIQNPEKIQFLINSFLMKKKYFYMKSFLEERSMSLLSIALLFSAIGPLEKTWRTFACPRFMNPPPSLGFSVNRPHMKTVILA